ncbi:MAG: HK97 family phage prohead protease [Bilophila wadsworthia]
MESDCGLVELKAAPDAGADSMTFSGYGAVFGNMDAYGDVIANGAFTKTIADFKTSGVWPAMLRSRRLDMSAESLTPIGVWTECGRTNTGCTSRATADTPRGREMRAHEYAAPSCHQRHVHRLPGHRMGEPEQAG